MADLSWFPVDAKAFQRRVRERGLSPTDVGMLMLLVCEAWPAAEPCTIRNTPDELARILGAQWKKGVAVLRAEFTPLDDQPTLVRCGWLYDLYLRQLEKHLSYAARGKKGGRPPKGESSAIKEGAQLEAELSGSEAELPALSRGENRTEALSCAPTEHTAKSPPPDDAPAPEGARFAGAVRGEGRLTGAAPLRTLEGPSGADRQAAHEERVRDYGQLLTMGVNDWIEEHREEAKAIGFAERARRGYAPKGELSTMKTEILRDAVFDIVRVRHGWPTLEQWDGSDFLAPSPAGATP